MSRHDCKRRRLRTLLLPLLLAGGCMPHVMHSPRVEPGATGAVSFTLGRNIDADDAEATYIPSLYAGGRWGHVPADGGPAFSIGAQVPFLLVPLVWNDANSNRERGELLLATSYLDGYVQPGRLGGGWEAGVGTLLSSALVAPYVQLGRLDARGTGWYTTQGLAFAGDPFSESVFWMPSLVWRDTGRRAAGNAASFGLSGGVGRENGSTIWWLSAAFTAEFGVRRTREDRPR